MHDSIVKLINKINNADKPFLKRIIINFMNNNSKMIMDLPARHLFFNVPSQICDDEDTIFCNFNLMVYCDYGYNMIGK